MIKPIYALYILIFILINIHRNNLFAGYVGNFNSGEIKEQRSIIQDDKVFTYVSIYEGLCHAQFIEANDRSITPGGIFDRFFDTRTCYVDIVVKISFTESCLVDVRNKQDLPVPKDLLYTCEKKFKPAFPIVVTGSHVHKKNCNKSMGQINKYYSENLNICRDEVNKNINFYANQMLLIKAQ
jgi:hypothetical protein